MNQARHSASARVHSLNSADWDSCPCPIVCVMFKSILDLLSIQWPELSHTDRDSSLRCGNYLICCSVCPLPNSGLLCIQCFLLWNSSAHFPLSVQYLACIHNSPDSTPLFDALFHKYLIGTRSCNMHHLDAYRYRNTDIWKYRYRNTNTSNVKITQYTF